MTAKTLNFVYEWIGPYGPLPNTRMPNIADLSWSLYQNDQQLPDFVHHPFFLNSFPEAHITTPGRMPEGKFIYELNFSNVDYRDRNQFFDHTTGVLSNNYHSQRVFERIRNEKDGYILVTILFEAWVSDQFFDKMHSFFNYHDIPLSQVIYATNCYNGQEIYNDYCKRKHIEPEINVEYFPTFRTHKTDIELVLEKYKNIPYEIGIREKTFLCFQRRINKHRIAILLNAVKTNNVEKYYISMDNKHPESKTPFIKEANSFVKKYSQLGFNNNDIERANAVLPLTLDTDNFSSYPMESSQFSTEHFYKTSLINIISETYFFDREIHLTEKTWKPIAFKQPFIMVGAKGTLQHIKDLGFKTFNNFWDEKYDELDDVNRINQIYKILNEIATWAPKTQKKFTERVKDIVEYNFNHLQKMCDTELNNFRNKYGN